MAHIQARRYVGGWWPAGPKEEAPDGTLRRNRGVRRFKEGEIRSRWGTELARPLDAHAIVRFYDVRYYAAGGFLYRDATPIGGISDTPPVTFARMPTSAGKEDHLFVAGGGRLIKVDAAGTESNWGIGPPPNGFTAAVSGSPPPPDTMTQTDSGAGSLSGAYIYRVAFMDAFGTVGPMNRTPLVTAPLAGRQITLNAIPTGPAGTARRLILRTHGNDVKYWHLVQIADNTTTTFVDNIADGAQSNAPGSENLQGTYQYHVTFKNTNTGTRSNANPTPVTIMAPTESTGSITLNNLPINILPGQSNAREIWRTVGNGNIFFLVTTINDNSTTTFVDNVPDVSLEEEELPDDNNAPYVDFTHFIAVAGPHSVRLWWRSGAVGKRGHLFYSPVARPEGVEDFIFVSNDDDPIHAHVVWGPAMYAFTEARIYEILGDGPFVARDIPEAPGTVQGRTVVPTPFGILYQATDGVRLFNGQNSRLIAFDAVGPLFHGEALEGVAPFEGTVAAFFDDEYLISNGVETLGLDLQRSAWRVLGYGCKALYAEPDTGALLGSVAGEVVGLERETFTTDNGRPITFEVEWPSVLVGVVYPGFVQFVNIVLDTGGATLTPTLFLDGVPLALPPLTTVGRQRVEWPVGRVCRVAGLRVSGSITTHVTIWAVDGEYYLGAPDVAVTAAAPAAGARA